MHFFSTTVTILDLSPNEVLKNALSLTQGANPITCEGSSRKSEMIIEAIDKSKMATTTRPKQVIMEKPKDVFSIFKKAVKRPATAMTEDGESIPPTSSTTFTLVNYLKEPQWKAGLIDEFEEPYMKNIEEFLQKQYEKKITVRPPKDEIFNAFNLTPLSEVKVVILGQDPYHDTNQAHGLSFSVKKGVAIPPSLVNIYKELAADIEGFNIPKHGNLLGWATQGVFMLNAALSVELHKANSHSQIGWHTFTNKVIEFISKNVQYCVFLLWGADAQKKSKLIDQNRHKVIMTAHPSPLSCYRGFKGSRCFSEVNKALKDHGMKPIDWNNLP
ncbi:unnamed protein product, partial [Mesorhabditis belari]|uniref:Uracil-DNA glycosylase n=1 Tax=Mesorhabditis belari TaxID=2138241 RepID=A0AAF3JBB9_9BILA